MRHSPSPVRGSEVVRRRQPIRSGMMGAVRQNIHRLAGFLHQHCTSGAFPRWSSADGLLQVKAGGGLKLAIWRGPRRRSASDRRGIAAAKTAAAPQTQGRCRPPHANLPKSALIALALAESSTVQALQYAGCSSTASARRTVRRSSRVFPIKWSRQVLESMPPRQAQRLGAGEAAPMSIQHAVNTLGIKFSHRSLSPRLAQRFRREIERWTAAGGGHPGRGSEPAGGQPDDGAEADPDRRRQPSPG